jgi:REP element-mobilizing transposase RayT
MPNYIYGIIKFFKAKTTIEIKSKYDELKFVATSENCIVAENLDFSSKQIWEKSFYDHIIRDEKDLARVQEYIKNNPKNWKNDILNKNNQDKYRNWIKRN